MAVVCPSILAADEQAYHDQMEKVAKFAKRIQIDLTDGNFAKTHTITPEQAWWPVGIKADFHLMYKNPHKAVDTVLEHTPNMIIVHAEADGDFLSLSRRCRELGIKTGVALLPSTATEHIFSALSSIDHVLIFSGHLGEFGGVADLDLLSKVAQIKQKKPSIEIGWDGGVNDKNVSQLVFGGVDVLDVGGFIQETDDPQRQYGILERIADETGTT